MHEERQDLELPRRQARAVAARARSVRRGRVARAQHFRRQVDLAGEDEPDGVQQHAGRRAVGDEAHRAAREHGEDRSAARRGAQGGDAYSGMLGAEALEPARTVAVAERGIEEHERRVGVRRELGEPAGDRFGL